MPEREQRKRSILRDPRFYYYSSIGWLIVAIIGFILLFLYSTPPQVMSLAEILGIVGILSTWYGILSGATLEGQNWMLEQHDKMLKQHDQMLDLLREILRALRESRGA